MFDFDIKKNKNKLLVWGGITLTVLIVGGYFFWGRKSETENEFTIAERKDIVQEVSVTGKVKPASKVDLSFELSGRVAGVFSDIGQKVYIGQKLAVLNNYQYQAQYSQAVAQLEAEKSQLDSLKKGSRPEEIAVQEAKIESAKNNLLDAQNNLNDKIRDAFTKADDAIRNETDQFFSNPRSFSPQFNFTTESFELKTAIENERSSIENLFNSWVAENDLAKTKENLKKINLFLDKVSLAINGLKISYGHTQTMIDGYKSAIAGARTNINTAIGGISSAEEKIRIAQSAIVLAERELILMQAGSTVEKIQEQEARVRSAEANVNNYMALLAKTFIVSPLNGIIVKKNIENGEIVQSNEIIFSVIGDAEYEMETFVPEADISKIKIGNPARVTLDAYESDVVFEAKVVSVEPTETVIDGVSTYKTILQFNKKDSRVKSGMTANIDILTDSRKNAITIPYRALHANGEKYVNLLGEDNKIIKKIVETGMRSSDGSLEILSGLSEGDRVIIK